MADLYLDLIKGQIVKLDARELDCIRVRSGEIWLTQERDSRDYILRAGSLMIPNRQGPVFIQARQQARLSLQAMTQPRATVSELGSMLRLTLARFVHASAGLLPGRGVALDR
jgi:hypothetical protein